MADETEKLTKAQAQLRQLTSRANDVNQLMRNQHQMLRQRGMNLPSGAIDGLRTFKNKITTLSKSVDTAQVELKQLRKLADITAVINSSQKTSEVLNQVMDTVIDLTRAERGYIVLKDQETGELEFAAARGIEEDGNQDFIISRGIVNRVADSGEPILTDNASEDEKFKGHASIADLKLRSILAVPLKIRGEVIGVAYCDNRILAGLFRQHDVDMLTAFGQQAAVALENARLFENTRLQLAEITEIRDLMNNIFTSIASGVITVDGQNVITVCNAAAILITGVPDAVGKPLNEVLPPMSEGFYQALQEVRTDGVQVTVVEEPINGSGKRFWYVIASPLQGETGMSEGVAITLDDLTEEKEQQARLEALGGYLNPDLLSSVEDVSAIDMSPQEREISALFADVRGFTSFSENLEPEDLMKIINKYLSVASDAIKLYDGIVDKYMGDAVTGLWNTQLRPQGDHAVRSVQAAKSLIYDLYALHETLEEDQQLYFGIGIHSGPAVLGNVGSANRKEFSALGEAMDVCKFLQESAGPGEIIVSASTHEQIEHAYECERIEPKKKKEGFEAFYEMYLVGKRKKSAGTSSLFVDEELLELLGDD